MRYKLLGGSGLRVSELFLGAMTLGEWGGVGTPPQGCRRILDAYADAGGNVIDTAINHRGGASGEILGELLGGRRDRFVLAAKCTVTRGRASSRWSGTAAGCGRSSTPPAPRPAAGEAGAVPMTEIRGASNAKAKRELGWRPGHPSWRQGFAP